MEETRVLVVDDVDDAARTLSMLLNLSGYATRTAHSGAEALAEIQHFMPHCILLDVGMPEMDGCELVQHLRAQHGDDIVLIAITGGSESDQRVAQTFEQVDYYLSKPVDVDALLRILPPTGAASGSR